MPLRLATWNVNSLKVRLPQLITWLQADPVDVICLQETKLTDDSFPAAALEELGYRCVFSGQKTYNGVAILARYALGEPLAVEQDLPGLDDPQRRYLAATIAGLRVICAYFPNGQEVGSDKYHYKLQWLDALQASIDRQLPDHAQLALLGDFNIAPEDRDVHDPALWAGKILCSDPERAAFQRLTGSGLRDAFRLFEQAERSYTWWDYRDLSFRRKLGLRIDHILLSPALASRCTSCVVATDMRRLERPSDHAPVIATLSDDASAAPSH